MIEQRRERGFTLIEVLIVTVTIGLLAATIAAVFVVLVRTTPPTEARADDARSLLGVTTWITSDASSTPQVPELTASANWDRTNVPSGCTGTDPGDNVLRLAWREQLSGSPVEYVVSYRLLDRGDTSVLLRISCVDGGSATRQNITADLPPVSETPVTVNWKTELRGTISYIVGVEVEITTIDGDVLRVDGASVNVNETLATNNAPVAAPTAISVAESSTVTFQLNATDTDGDTLSAVITNIPSGWVVVPTSGSTVSVDLSAGAGTGNYTLDYEVSDGTATASSTIEVTVVAPSGNSAPVAGVTIASVEESQSTSFALNTFDADGDVLTATITNIPTDWVVSPTPGTTVMVSLEPVGASPGPYTLDYFVSDGTAPSELSTIEVTVLPLGGPVNNAPIANPTVATVQDGGTTSFALNASDPDVGDTLAATISNAPIGWTVTSTPGTTVLVEIDTSTVGPGEFILDYTVTDGAATSAPSTITVTVTPQPCSAAFASSGALTPNPVEHADSSNGAKKVAPLLQDVTVTITTTGDCSDLRLRYFLTDEASSLRLRNFGDPDWLTLPGNLATERWQRGDHVLELVEIPTIGAEIPHDTAVLTVVRDT